jgi:hypothetical protein
VADISDSGPPFRMRARCRRIAVAILAWRSTLLGDFLIAVAVAALSLAWIHPSGTYLFGQDSINWINPFSFNTDPLVQYSYTYSASFPITDSAPEFYVAAFSQTLHTMGLTTPTLERVVIVLGSLLAAFGSLHLSSTLNAVNGRPRYSYGAARALATLSFAFNPVALTMAWWHFEYWSFLYVLAPYLVAALLEIVYLPSPSVARLSAILILAIGLGPGLNGQFAVLWGLLGLSALVALLLRIRVLKSQSFGLMPRLTALVLLLAGSSLWMLVPFILPTLQGVAASQYYPPISIRAALAGYTPVETLANVLSLQGFGWAYSAPSAYAWAWYLPVLRLASLIFPIALAISLFHARRWAGLTFVATLILVLAVLSTDLNPPFGQANLWLASIGGPFLFIIDGYNVSAPVLAALFVVPIFVCGAEVSRRIAAHLLLRDVQSPPAGPSPYRAARPSLPLRSRRRGQLKSFGYVGVGACLLILVVATSVPFDLNQVYQTRGANIGEFSVPSDVGALGEFFARNYSGPLYNVLLMPLSSSNALPAQFNNQSFVDSFLMLAQVIPYPVIWADNSPLESNLTVLLSGQPTSLVWVFEALHIRYAVVNPHVDRTSYYLTHATDGALINWTSIYRTLTSEFGAPLQVGGFSVYTCQGSTPLVSVETKLSVVRTPTMMGYLSLLSKINASSPTPLVDLGDSLFGATNPIGSATLEYQPFSPLSGRFSFPANSTVSVLNDTGWVLSESEFSALSTYNGLSVNRSDGTAVYQPDWLLSLNNTSGIQTTFAKSGSSYSNSLGATGTLSYSESLSGVLRFVEEINVSQAASQNWLTTTLSSGNSTLTAGEYFLGGSSNRMVLQMTAYSKGVPYAWNNSILQLGNQTGRFFQVLYLNATTVGLTLESSSLPAPGADSLVYSPRSQLMRNGGSNLTAATDLFNASKAYSASTEFAYTGATLDEFSVAASIPATELLTSQNDTSTNLVASAVSVDDSGNFHVTFSSKGTGGHAFVVLSYPQFPLWVARDGGATGERVLVSEFQNVFLFAGLASDSMVTVVVQFEAYLDDGLYVSMSEVVAASALILFVKVRRRRPK